MANYLTQNEELFRIGLKHRATDGIDTDPDVSYSALVQEMIRTKEAVTTMSVREGFALFQDKPVGLPAPMQEEQFKVKKFRTRRFALGYDEPLNIIDRDPNGLAAKKGAQLKASCIHTMNYLAELAILQCVTGSTNARTSAFDGLTIYNAAHVAGNGNTQSNLLAIPLTPDNVITAIETLAAQANTQGLPTKTHKSYDICVPSAKFMSTQVIVDSELKQGTNNNDKNVLRGVLNVVALDWWSLAGAGIQNDWMLQSSEASKRPLMGIQTQELKIGMDKFESTGIAKTVASFEILFDAISHYGTLYSSGS
jgi:hypothetical protein